MVRPPREYIDTFISITGVSEAEAVLKLEEHGGNLNEAVDAYYNDGDNRTAAHLPATVELDADDMDIDPLPGHVTEVPPFVSTHNRFSPLDTFFPSLFPHGDHPTNILNREPRVSHPREVRTIPIEFKDSNSHSGPSGQGIRIEDVSEDDYSHAPVTQPFVSLVDDDDDGAGFPSAHFGPHEMTYPNPSVASAPPLNDYSETEEQMLQAALEASKREAEAKQHVNDDSVGPEVSHELPPSGDEDLARAMSLSIETADLERVKREHGLPLGDHSSDLYVEDELGRIIPTEGRQGVFPGIAGPSSRLASVENKHIEEEEDEYVDERPLARRRRRGASSKSAESTQHVQVDGSTSSPPAEGDDHDNNEDAYPTDEWGGISTEEHDEAVMLEAAMFGTIPDGTAYHFSYPSRARNSAFYPRAPSPRLTEQRLLREQQDDEYQASLKADQAKELKAMHDAEEAAAARKAEVEKQKKEEEEQHRMLREEEELQSMLALKEASLPEEPPLENEAAVTLSVRMPDGSRRGRRFLKSDKLQLLFDFIDVGRTVKPGTYRLVQSYPRRAFTAAEGELSFSELGLTSKLEGLFLELI